MNKHPKIAILSMTNISCSNATGSLLFRLFKTWDKNNITQICKYNHQDEVSELFHPPLPFYDLLEKERTSNNPLVKYPAVGIRRIFFPLKYKNGNQDKLLQHLKSFQPDLLYLRVVGIPFYYLTLTLFLKEKLGIPLVLHFMDDYDLQLQIKSKNSVIKKYQSEWYSKTLAKVIQKSDLNLVISESMKTGFKERYGIDSHVVHNGIEPEEFDFFKNNKIEKKENTFRLLWAGAIARGKDDQILMSILNAIQKANASSEVRFEILFNVPKRNLPITEKLAEQFDFVKYQAYQPLEEYRRLLASSHLLLIVRNFDDETKAYTQYSFHNKLPDFLASGTPILSIGAEWDGTIQLFQQYNFGEYLLSSDVNDICKKLLNIKDNYSKITLKATTASELGFEKYNLKTIRDNLVKSFYEIISSKNKYVGNH